MLIPLLRPSASTHPYAFRLVPVTPKSAAQEITYYHELLIGRGCA
jgi:hypothetical protein